jgi:hypothetical protein
VPNPPTLTVEAALLLSASAMAIEGSEPIRVDLIEI